MDARTPQQAAQAHLASLQRAVSCVSTAVLISAPAPPGQVRYIKFAQTAVRLRGPVPLSLGLLVAVAVEPAATGRWTTATAGYQHEVLDRDGLELFAYHWHPTGRSHVTTPHLHVSARAGPLDLDKRHLPTGPVSLPAVLRCLIEEFAVEPLRPDWRAILADPA